MKLATVCIEVGCAALTTAGARCDLHQREYGRLHPRGNTTRRGYGYEWQQKSRAVIERDAGWCYLCGQYGADTADHVIPKALGGTDDLDNLRASHVACNSRKGARL